MIKVKKVRPMFCGVLTTADKYENAQLTEGGLIDGSHLENTPKEYQTVVAVGNAVRAVAPGDVVVIDPTRFIRRKYDKNSIQNDLDNNPVVSVEIPTMEIDGKEHFLIEDRDILYVLEEFEEVPDEAVSPIIKPKAQKLII